VEIKQPRGSIRMLVDIRRLLFIIVTGFRHYHLPFFSSPNRSYLHLSSSALSTAANFSASVDFGSINSNPSTSFKYSGPICCARASLFEMRASTALVSLLRIRQSRLWRLVCWFVLLGKR